MCSPCFAFRIAHHALRNALCARLGNRSALDWVIDQYRVKTDKRSGIVNDPNRADDQEYIVRLIGQVISVSLETVNIVESLPALGVGEGEGTAQVVDDSKVS